MVAVTVVVPVQALRKKGLAAADKKAGRVAAEGLLAQYIHAGSRSPPKPLSLPPPPTPPQRPKTSFFCPSTMSSCPYRRCHGLSMFVTH